MAELEAETRTENFLDTWEDNPISVRVVAKAEYSDLDGKKEGDWNRGHTNIVPAYVIV